LTNPAGQRLAPAAAAGRRLQRGDTLLLVATRRGLARLIAETTAPPPEATPRKTIVLHDAHPFDRMRQERPADPTTPAAVISPPAGPDTAS
jgi:hypothetical protein